MWGSCGGRGARTTLAIWRLSTRALLRTITPCHTTAFLGMSLSRGSGDPRIATAGADGSVVLWSATTGEQLAVWSDSAVRRRPFAARAGQ